MEAGCEADRAPIVARCHPTVHGPTTVAPTSCNKCHGASATRSNACSRTRLCPLPYNLFFSRCERGPSVDSYIPWAPRVVLWRLKASCHLGKEVNLNILTDLLSFLHHGSHVLFPVARNPLRGDGFELKVVSYLGLEIHVSAFAACFASDAHGDASVVDVLFVIIISKSCINDSRCILALGDCWDPVYWAMMRRGPLVADPPAASYAAPTTSMVWWLLLE